MTDETAIYFHVPFCLKKCPYCHYYSIYPKRELIDLYIEAILLDLSRYKFKKIGSIFFGGGTPSLLDPEDFEKILKKLKKIDKNCEITMEVDPKEISCKKIKNLKALGINRISVGVQSFDNKMLKMLGREHSKEEAKEAIYNIYSGGIDNISIDLIYDIPGMTLSIFEDSIKNIKTLPISHISLYNLSIEKGTPFYRDRKRIRDLMPDEGASLKSLLMAKRFLKEQGFRRYEIASYAKDNRSSKHNICYWRGRPFLGFGPSSFSYIDGERFKKIDNLIKYHSLLKKGESPIDFSEKLPYPKNIKELLVINLRMISGINLKKFQKKNPLPKETLETIELLKRDGFLKGSIRLTKKGLLFYDHVASLLI